MLTFIFPGTFSGRVEVAALWWKRSFSCVPQHFLSSFVGYGGCSCGREESFRCLLSGFFFLFGGSQVTMGTYRFGGRAFCHASYFLSVLLGNGFCTTVGPRSPLAVIVSEFHFLPEMRKILRI